MNITDDNHVYNFKGVSFNSDGGSVNFHFMMETDEKPTRETLTEFGKKYALTYKLCKSSSKNDKDKYGKYLKYKGVTNDHDFEFVDDELELATLSSYIRKYFEPLDKTKTQWYYKSGEMKQLRRLERLYNLLEK